MYPIGRQMTAPKARPGSDRWRGLSVTLDGQQAMRPFFKPTHRRRGRRSACKALQMIGMDLVGNLEKTREKLRGRTTFASKDEQDNERPSE